VAATDYMLTAAGDLHLVHNGVVARAGRKVSLDSASPITATLLRLGWITATLTGNPQYHDAAANLTTYHVTASGAGHILHSTATAASAPLAQGASISLDPLDAGAQLLLSRGLIS
jgi:hypothetical protein